MSYYRVKSIVNVNANTDFLVTIGVRGEQREALIESLQEALQEAKRSKGGLALSLALPRGSTVIVNGKVLKGRTS